MQSDRLASIGQLVAGIAHEINNPVGVIYLYSTESLKLFERITQAFQRLSSLPFFEDIHMLNEVAIHHGQDANIRSKR